MDKLASKLRDDAATIDAEISAQLESRIQASLTAIEPDAARQRKPGRRRASFWLTSSLTGVAAALGVFAVLNLVDTDEPEAVPTTAAVEAAVQPIELPAIDLDVKAATLAGPLAQELEDLQADLRKAEEVMRGDVRIDF